MQSTEQTQNITDLLQQTNNKITNIYIAILLLFVLILVICLIALCCQKELTVKVSWDRDTTKPSHCVNAQVQA